MNKFVQGLFIILLPFYPFWAWGCSYLSEKSFAFFISIFFLTISIYSLIYSKTRLPKYLLFFIFFTIYHISSAFINNTIPTNTHRIYFILSDVNVLACLVLLIVENTSFTRSFILKMNQYIFLVVLISVIFSLIQIKDPFFFFKITDNPDWGLGYINQERNFSIYSWINYHSLGISFPILISILLSQYSIEGKNFQPFIVVLIGITVCFLSRYRFAMISSIIVSSQLVFIKSNKLYGRLLLLFLAVGTFIMLGYISKLYGFKIDEVINHRILEKESDMMSANARVTSYEVFMLKFPEHPWFGVGPKTGEDVIDLLGGAISIIHIGYLSYLYYYGIFGALLLFLSLFYLLKRAWIVGKTNRFWGSFYGLIAFCIANLAFVYFDLSEMGVITGLVYLRYYIELNSLKPAVTHMANCKSSL